MLGLELDLGGCFFYSLSLNSSCYSSILSDVTTLVNDSTVSPRSLRRGSSLLAFTGEVTASPMIGLNLASISFRRSD